MLVLMLVALLLYGGELPKVARSWGKSLAEFKKGMSGIQNEFNNVFYDEPRRIPYHDPVYSHNAGTIDAHLADDAHVADDHGAVDDHKDETSGYSAVSTSAESVAMETAATPARAERESI
jgi:Sec-independent protein translocase protein TatA